jgi:hypothetical protein
VVCVVGAWAWWVCFGARPCLVLKSPLVVLDAGCSIARCSCTVQSRIQWERGPSRDNPSFIAKLPYHIIPYHTIPYRAIATRPHNHGIRQSMYSAVTNVLLMSSPSIRSFRCLWHLLVATAPSRTFQLLTVR